LLVEDGRSDQFVLRPLNGGRVNRLPLPNGKVARALMIRWGWSF
jgi:hypothetical protein